MELEPTKARPATTLPRTAGRRLGSNRRVWWCSDDAGRGPSGDGAVAAAGDGAPPMPPGRRPAGAGGTEGAVNSAASVGIEPTAAGDPVGTDGASAGSAVASGALRRASTARTSSSAGTATASDRAAPCGTLQWIKACKVAASARRSHR